MEEKLKKIDEEKDRICEKPVEVKAAPKPKKHTPPPVPLTTSGKPSIPSIQDKICRNDRLALNGLPIQLGKVQEKRQEPLQRRHRFQAQMAKRRNLSRSMIGLQSYLLSIT